jgi:hypothetical protein
MDSQSGLTAAALGALCYWVGTGELGWIEIKVCGDGRVHIRKAWPFGWVRMWGPRANITQIGKLLPWGPWVTMAINLGVCPWPERRYGRPGAGKWMEKLGPFSSDVGPVYLGWFLSSHCEAN